MNKDVHMGTPIDEFGKTYWMIVRDFLVGVSKPLRVGRVYGKAEVELDCYITDRVLELCQTGKLNVDDVVMVQFIDGDPAKAIVVDKIHKSQYPAQVIEKVSVKKRP